MPGKNGGKFYTLMGQTMNIRGWAHKYNMTPNTLGHRLRIGMTLQEALFTPVGSLRRAIIRTNVGDLTLDQVAKIAKVSPKTVSTRRCRGWKGSEIFAPNLRQPVLEAFGKKQTAAQWEKETGIKRRVIFSRIRMGWTMEDVLSVPVVNHGTKRKALRITAFGRTLTIWEWAKETGMIATTIRGRIEDGLPPEMALTLPTRKRKKVNA